MKNVNVVGRTTIPNGKFTEKYTPVTGRIVSPALGKQLEFAKILLTQDANVTYVDAVGNLCTGVLLSKGQQNFLVREIRSTGGVEVYIVHDGLISTASDD